MTEGAAFCANCGQAFSVDAAAPRTPMISAAAAAPLGGGGAAFPADAGYAVVPRFDYAAFWVRFLAWLIDNVVMPERGVLIVTPLIFLLGLPAFIRDFHPN